MGIGPVPVSARALDWDVFVVFTFLLDRLFVNCCIAQTVCLTPSTSLRCSAALRSFLFGCGCVYLIGASTGERSLRDAVLGGGEGPGPQPRAVRVVVELVLCAACVRADYVHHCAVPTSMAALLQWAIQLVRKLTSHLLGVCACVLTFSRRRQRISYSGPLDIFASGERKGELARC